MSAGESLATGPRGRDVIARLDAKQLTILGEWGAQILEGDEPVAFGAGDRVRELANLYASGRGLALVGPRGVGKTVQVAEAAREAHRAGAPWPLLRLSIRRRKSKCNNHQQFMKAFEALAGVIAASGAAPFFEDGEHMAGSLAEPLVDLLTSIEAPVVIEGDPVSISALFEDEDELDEHFMRIPIPEPDIDETQSILRSLIETHPERISPTPDAGAIEEAVYLGQRFLSRSHFPGKAIDLLSQASGGSEAFNRERVLERFCELHSTPRWLVDPRAPLDFGALEARLGNAILGQPEAVGAAARLVATMKTGLSDLRRPFGTLLFTGPTGVGKTHLAQTLASVLFGGPDRMIRINMGDYATDEGFGLFGNPHTYDLGGKRGALTQAFLGRPFAVLLLDELEKAHPVLMDRLLPLMDEGVFINGAGETISCRSMIIIATTNAGAEVYRGAGIGFAGDQDLDEKRRRVEHRVREVFRFEFLNRFDAVVHFNPLSRQACRTIAQWELERLRHRVGLRRYGLQLSIDETVLDWLAVHGYHPDFGARFMKRTIERSVTRTVAESIVRRQPPPGAKLELLVRGQAIHCRVEPPRSKPRSAPIVPKNPPEGSRPVMSAAELTKRAAPLLQELSRREEERASLLERMGAEPFGQDPEREVVLQRFRELEVWVHMARRHAEPIEAWRLDSDREHGLLEATEACLRWEERSRHAGPGRIWVDISAADVHPSNPAFLHDLVDIYLRYAQRRDFEAHVEAIELRAKGPSRLVLEVQGPGCLHWFSAEAGLHRKRVASGPDALARVQVLPRNATSSRRPTRARSGKEDGVQLDLAFEVQIEVPRVGRVSRLAGANAPTLGCLADDLEAVLATQPLDSSPARLYGGTVSDPRTGVSVPSAQVEEGRLEAFLEGWIAAGRTGLNTWS